MLVTSSLAYGAAHNAAEQFIANLAGGEKCEGKWIKITAHDDGTFTVTNSRNEFTKAYGPSN